MYELLFGGNAAWFSIPAIIGTVFFALRVVLMLVGGAADLDLDLDADVGGAGATLGETDVHWDSGHAFQVLSIQSLAAFVMGFGWGGLAALKGSGWEWPAVIVTSLVCGAGMVWLLGLLLKGIHDLQASGNVSIHAAVGHEGDVYCTIPGEGRGRGQVRMTIQNRQRIYNAVTLGEDLPTSTRVRVTQVNEDNTLTVARA